MNELSVEQKEDVKQRMKEFAKDYEALVERLQVDFAQWPVCVPTGPGLFSLTIQAQLQDKKYLAPLSPIQQ